MKCRWSGASDRPDEFDESTVPLADAQSELLTCTGPLDVEIRYAMFDQQGRALYLIVALGDTASPTLREQVWRALNTLDVQ